MTFNRFEQICKDYGLNLIFNPACKNVKDGNTYARAFYKNEVVAIYNNRRIYCYPHPSTFRYASIAMMIDNGECTEVYSTTELEENFVQTIEKLKKLFIKIKKFEIEKEFK